MKKIKQDVKIGRVVELGQEIAMLEKASRE